MTSHARLQVKNFLHVPNSSSVNPSLPDDTLMYFYEGPADCAKEIHISPLQIYPHANVEYREKREHPALFNDIDNSDLEALECAGIINQADLNPAKTPCIIYQSYLHARRIDFVNIG